MLRRNSLLLAVLLGLSFSGIASAQDWGGPGGPGRGDRGGPPPMERAFHDQGFGKWWNDPRLAQELNITADQKKQMDSIFQQHLLNLIDLKANLEKQQVLLGPMISADQPNEADVLAQIDKVAQARADLEKANARMLFDIRKTLTPDQWQKLKTLHQERRDQRRMRPMGGPGRWRQHQDNLRTPPPPGQQTPAQPAPPQGDQAPQPPQ